MFKFSSRDGWHRSVIMNKRILVVGSGAAGMTAASSAREQDAQAEITVVTEDRYVAYSPCAIPFVIDGTISDFDSIVMHTPDFYREEKSIEVLTQTMATTVDIEKKACVLSNGTTRMFDALVIATGGSVMVPPVEGVRLPGVFGVRSIDDGKAIQAASISAITVAIVGAGVIGLEMALAMKKLGKHVIVVEMLPQVVPRILDADMAEVVQRHCESKGLRFILKTPLGKVLGKERVEGIVAGNENIASDMVILATGVRPNLEIPNQLGLEIGALGGVRVSPSLHPYRKGRPMKDLYLAGDVIMCDSEAINGPTMSQLGSSAVRQGKVAGINAAGGQALYPGSLGSWISQLGDMQVAGSGLSRGLADYYGVTIAEGKAVGLTRARYYPGGRQITVKLMAERSSRRIVGAQIVGGEEVTGRINWLSGAILARVTVEEFVSNYENAYCPPTSMVKDVVVSAAEDLLKKL